MKKKADKTNVTVNINILNNITLDGKSLSYILIAILLTLVVSICDPSAHAEIIRFIISIATDC